MSAWGLRSFQLPWLTDWIERGIGGTWRTKAASCPQVRISGARFPDQPLLNPNISLSYPELHDLTIFVM
jgi:hypothetical protein